MNHTYKKKDTERNDIYICIVSVEHKGKILEINYFGTLYWFSWVDKNIYSARVSGEQRRNLVMPNFVKQGIHWGWLCYTGEG